MTPHVLLAVLLAAALHAAWNALVKRGADKHLGMTAVLIGHVPFALATLPFVPAPAHESLPWLVAGICLHLGYQLLLLTAYRTGDLTQVYPIARGSAPLIVAAVSITILGVALGPLEILAIAFIAAGILSLAVVRRKDGLRNGRAALQALGAGAFIAGYSLVDGLGARVAGTALGFYAWLAIGNAAVFAAVMLAVRPDVLRRLPEARRDILLGGGASFAAYAIVVWAFTRAPIALVTALRETSIVFALLIGVFALGERLDRARVASTLTTLLGAALLRIAQG